MEKKKKKQLGLIFCARIYIGYCSLELFNVELSQIGTGGDRDTRRWGGGGGGGEGGTIPNATLDITSMSLH